MGRPRQFCCVCLQTVTEYRTLLYREGTARFHFCFKPDCFAHFNHEHTSARVQEVPA